MGRRWDYSLPISSSILDKYIPKKWWEFVTTLLIIALAAIPPLLIIQQRWFHSPIDYDVNQYGYGLCSIQLFCRSTIASSALLLFIICSVSLILLFMLSRRRIYSSFPPDEFNTTNQLLVDMPDQHQLFLFHFCIIVSGLGFIFIEVSYWLRNRLPNWDLIVVIFIYLLGWLFHEPKYSGMNIKSIVNLSGIALVIAEIILLAITIFYLFHHSRMYLLSIITFILVLAILIRFYPKLRYITLILCMGIVLFSVNIDSWQTSYIKDEYPQFDLALSIVNGKDISTIANNIFSAEGNYHTTPMMATDIQVFFMEIFGADGFGWRISNPILCTLAIGLLYYFYYTFLGEPLALAAATLLACSEYIMSFSKIGYSNLQAFFILSLVLTAAVWALKSNRFFAFIVLGLFMGLSFYLFPAALYTLPIPILLLLVFFPPITKAAIKRWAAILSSIGIIIFPLFLQPVYWVTKIPGTFLDHTLYPNTFGGYVDHFSSNAFNAYLSFLYIQQNTHFVSISYVDPLTGLLFLLGISYSLLFFRKSRFMLFSLISFIMMLLLVGVSHGYLVPPTTRMFLLLPWWVLFAAFGLKYLLGQIQHLINPSSSLSFLFLACILIFVALMNIYQSLVVSYTMFSDMQTVEPNFVKTAAEIEKTQPGIIKNYIILMDNTKETGEFIRFKSVYPEYFQSSTVQEVMIDSPVLSNDILTKLTNSNTIVFIDLLSNPSWREIVESALMKSGRKPCEYTNHGKRKLLYLYSSLEFIDVCR